MAKRDERGARILDYPDYRPGGNGTDMATVQNMDDVSLILRTAQTRLRTGRPTAVYPATESGLKAFIQGCDDYFTYLNEQNARLKDTPNAKPLIADIEGLGVFLGLTRQTINAYQHRGGDWEEVISYVKNAIAAAKKEVAFHYGMPPVLAMFDLTNNHGYVNSSEFKIAGNTDREREETRLQGKLDSEGLIFDENSGEYIPVEVVADDNGGEPV